MSTNEIPGELYVVYHPEMDSIGIVLANLFGPHDYCTLELSSGYWLLTPNEVERFGWIKIGEF